MDMRRIDQFCDLISQLFGIGNLLLRILFLQDAIKRGDDVAVDLFSSVSSHTTCFGVVLVGRTWSAHSRQWARSLGSPGGSNGVPSLRSSS
jgi:hypothetical protein